MSCQQDELYAAQAECDSGCRLTYARAQELANEVRETPWFVRNFEDKVLVIDVRELASSRFGPNRAWVSGGKARYDASTQSGAIGLTPEGLVEVSFWHEVAHVLCDARYGANAHGPWYARTLLELTYTVRGSAAYAELRAAFDRHGVDYDTDSAVPGGIAL